MFSDETFDGGFQKSSELEEAELGDTFMFDLWFFADDLQEEEDEEEEEDDVVEDEEEDEWCLSFS